MISFENVTKSFKGHAVLKDVNIKIDEGDIVVLIGPSGCGKTTMLKMINKLVKASNGRIFIDNKNINQIDPIKLRRNIGYVIQQTGLFPHMTVRENIEIISKIQGQSPEDIKEKTLQLMSMVGLNAEQYLDRYPSELSGGQQQRIGVARAFACDSDIILMDEPFSALDPITREQLQNELIMMQKELKKTIIFVTHDMDEAFRVADKICIMKNGVIVQYDQIEEILKNPNSEYISDFVGKNRIWSMPQFIKGSDIMKTTFIVVKPDDTVEYCLEKMKKNNTESILVKDENNKLVGISSINTVQHITDKNIKISEICEKEIVSVNPNSSILEIMKFFNDKNINNIPVIDNKKYLYGLITLNSLIEVISENIYLNNNSKQEVKA